jgi:hypothetical protein
MWVRLGISVLLTALTCSCLFTPRGSYQTPELLGEGNWRIGVVGGVGTAGGVDVVSWIDDCDGKDCLPSWIEGSIFFDLGLNARSDLRLRLSTIALPRAMDGAGIYQIGPGFELKFTKAGGHISIVTGADLLFAYTPHEPDPHDDDGDGWLWPSLIDVDIDGIPTLAPFVGAVFGIGDPGGIRLLLAPKLVTPSFALFDGRLAVGVDFPIAERFSLRPEIVGSCLILLDEEPKALCSVSAGAAVVF